MEEQTLQFKENLINIRNIIVGNRKKIKKVRLRNDSIERIAKEKKKNRLKEKILESSRATGRLITGAGAAIGNAIPKDKKQKLGNALGLFAMFLIFKNFDKIKEVISGFLNGDIFKSIKEGFENLKNFFQNIYKSFQDTRQLFGEKYEQFIAFKNERLKDIEKVTETLRKIGDAFKKISEKAIELKEKFKNLLTGNQNKKENIPIEEEKKGLEKYGFDDEKFDLIMGEDGNYRVVPKNNNETSSISEGLGLTDFNNFQLDTNPFKLPEDFVPFDYSKLGDSIFDYSQFNFDEMNKQTFIYSRTNTILKD